MSQRASVESRAGAAAISNTIISRVDLAGLPSITKVGCAGLVYDVSHNDDPGNA